MTLLNPVPKSSTGTLATTSPLSGGGPMSGNVTVGLTLSNARNYLRGDGTWQTRPWFYTRDYGAVGDGTTDDTAAVQAAIDAAIAVNGRVIVHGICSVDTLVITKSILIEGEHEVMTYQNNTFLGHVPYIGSCLKSRSGGVILKFTSDWHHFGGVRNLRFSGGSPILWDAMTDDVKQFVLEQISFEDCTGYLFDNFNADPVNHYGTCYQFTWRNLQATQCDKGMRIVGGPACTIIGYYVDGISNNNTGLEFTNGNLHLISYNSGYLKGWDLDPLAPGGLTGGNTGCCLKVYGCQVLVENTTFEGWYDTAVKWDGTGQIAFRNCWFRDSMPEVGDPSMQQIAIAISGPSSTPIVLENTQFLSPVGWKLGTPIVQTAGSETGAASVLMLGMDDQLENYGVPGVYLNSTSAIRPASFITKGKAVDDGTGTIRQCIEIPYLHTAVIAADGNISVLPSGGLLACGPAPAQNTGFVLSAGGDTDYTNYQSFPFVVNNKTDPFSHLKFGYDITHDFAVIDAVRQGSGARMLYLQSSGGGTKFGGNVGFNGAAPIAKPTITGSKGGNAALASIATALATYGLVTDSTTA